MAPQHPQSRDAIMMARWMLVHCLMDHTCSLIGNKLTNCRSRFFPLLPVGLCPQRKTLRMNSSTNAYQLHRATFAALATNLQLGPPWPSQVQMHRLPWGLGCLDRILLLQPPNAYSERPQHIPQIGHGDVDIGKPPPWGVVAGTALTSSHLQSKITSATRSLSMSWWRN